jgi:LCP family protein required for cell wall assembly
MPNNLSRRDLLKLLAAGAGGTLLLSGDVPKFAHNTLDLLLNRKYIDQKDYDQLKKGGNQVDTSSGQSQDLPNNETNDSESGIMNWVSGIRENRLNSNPELGFIWNPELLNRVGMVYIGRTDGYMGPPDAFRILSVDLKNLAIDNISIPRELYTPELNATLNSSWTMAGYKPDLTISEMEKITGHPIDFWFYTGTQDIIAELVDMVDGIDVLVSDGCYEPRFGVNYDTGKTYHLNGKEATVYARMRYCDTDFARSDRQQDVILAWYNKVMDLIKDNPGKIMDFSYNMIKIFLKYQNEKDPANKPFLQYGASDSSSFSLDKLYDFASLLIEKRKNKISPQLGVHVNIGDFAMINYPGKATLYNPFSEGARFFKSYTPYPFFFDPKGIPAQNLATNTRELLDKYYNYPGHHWFNDEKIGARDWVASLLMQRMSSKKYVEEITKTFY